MRWLKNIRKRTEVANINRYEILNLKADDVLVISVSEPMSNQALEILKEKIKQYFGEHKVMVVNADIVKFTVIKKGAAHAEVAV